MNIGKWVVVEPITFEKTPKCVLLLPGRGLSAEAMLHVSEDMGLHKHLQIALEPVRRLWYPMPNGPKDQDQALFGLRKANRVVLAAVERINKAWGVEQKDIAVLGFSAGGVVALDLATNTKAPFACCISMSGTILAPEKVRPAVNQTPIIVQHNRYDDVFS